ncbi:hypothetical protein LIER_26128 [Lithospermum erythrorhizon]|uniref:Uncharacterized protein n=1 Tax=Lithospermum erythrorhizon TaxID=34254 RepID=A0AAV3R8U7_LITER
MHFKAWTASLEHTSVYEKMESGNITYMEHVSRTGPGGGGFGVGDGLRGGGGGSLVVVDDEGLNFGGSLVVVVVDDDGGGGRDGAKTRGWGGAMGWGPVGWGWMGGRRHSQWWMMVMVV